MSRSRRGDDGDDAAPGLDWRGPAIGASTWLGAWAGTSGTSWVVAATVVTALVLGGVARWRRSRLLAACALVVLAALGVSGARSWFAGTGPVPSWAREGAVVTIEVRVSGGRVADSGPGGPLWTADGVVRTVTGRDQVWDSGVTVRLSASGDLTRAWASLPAGATVRAVVRLSPAAVDEPVSAWARARTPPEVVVPPSPVDAAVTTVRAGLRQAVAGLPPDPRALVPALVVGDTDGMTAELQATFRATGLTHLTAVSGANLTLMLAAMLWFAGRLGLSGWWRRGVVLVGVVAFVLLCRAEPSVLRAAAMGVIGLAALGWGGTRQGLRYLSWAVVLLVLLDPWLCRSTGFALSVCASGGIIWWAGRWARTLERWLPTWLAEAVVVPVAAQVATQPIVTAISGQISIAGIAANVVAAPLVGPGTVLGFLAAGLSVVAPPLASVAGWLAGGFAQALCWVAEVGSSLPGAVFTWPDGPFALGVLTACCAVALLGLPLLWRRPWLAVALAVAMVGVLLRPVAVPGWPPRAWQFVSCDVGQGDASVVAAGDGRAIVVDTGPDPRAVDRCLDQLGISEVAWLVITHLHADHVGGVAGVASGRRVDNVLYSGITEPEGGWRLLASALPGVPRTVAEPGLVVAAGPVQLAVLAVKSYVAGGAVGEDSADQNDSSVVMRVTSGNLRVLLGGDVEEAGQSNAVATAPDLSAQVLLVPHHGSAHQSPAFLGAVGESVALVSVGKDNDYGHPAARTVATVADTGARVFRTDVNGAIAVALDGDTLVVTTQRTP
ncbi:MAG: ComEC/Rec2 family competence protein [Actinobacteria bacterium]|nr:ComEC/Rec2 family competence protein [Actinomycetota bacterium]